MIHVRSIIALAPLVLTFFQSTVLAEPTIVIETNTCESRINEGYVRDVLKQGATCLAQFHRPHLDQVLQILEGMNDLLISCESEMFQNHEIAAAYPGPSLQSGRILFNSEAFETADHVQIANSLFHESLHLTGLRHGETLDYVYTCADCCFPVSWMGESFKRHACEMCAYDPSSGSIINQIRLTSEFLRERGMPTLNQEFILKQLANNEDDGSRLWRLLFSSFEGNETFVLKAGLVNALAQHHLMSREEQKSFQKKWALFYRLEAERSGLAYSTQFFNALVDASQRRSVPVIAPPAGQILKTQNGEKLKEFYALAITTPLGARMRPLFDTPPELRR